MGRLRRVTAAWRAVLGAVALYGLLLQPFVAAASPILPPGLGALCADHGGGPGPSAPARHDPSCCTPAALGGHSLLPPPPGDAAPAPAEPLIISWSARIDDPVPAPGRSTHYARGPPAA